MSTGSTGLLHNILPFVKVFARVSPQHKVKLMLLSYIHVASNIHCLTLNHEKLITILFCSCYVRFPYTGKCTKLIAKKFSLNFEPTGIT